MTSYADHAAARADELRNRAELAGVHLVIEQRIVDDAGSTVEAYQLAMRDGAIGVDPTCGADPDVVISQDAATAAALRSGELHAQPAFLTGRLRIDGDVNRLLEHRDALVALMEPGDA